MPVADYKTYCRMIDHALENKFAYPAINVTSLTTANGVLKGLAESKSDGIIQISTGGAAFASGFLYEAWGGRPGRTGESGGNRYEGCWNPPLWKRQVKESSEQF
jgi:fructose/tagatose bisphosphate aldolase